MPDREITVNSLKFDRSISRTWKCELIASSGVRFEFVGRFETDVSHHHLGMIRAGTISYEYFWLDRWYSIFRFHEPDHTLRNWYCNVNLPPTFNDGVLSYIDLDIDIVVWPDLSYEILDLDEFKANAARYSYPKTVIAGVERAQHDVLTMIGNRSPPFDRYD